MQAVSGYPPFEKQEKDAFDEQYDRVYGSCKRAKVHRAPYSCHEVHLWRAQNRFVHALRARRHVFPVVEPLYTLMRTERIVLAVLDY